VQNIGGVISDTYEDETRLFIRSILPQTRDVAPQDRLQSGVALRASLEEILVSPYVFRLVCSNGAIMAHALGTEQITQVSSLPAYEVDSIMRSMIQACASEELFASATDQIRLARTTPADTALSLLPHLSRLPHSQARRVMESVFARWRESTDRSRFALMNIV